MLYEENKNNEEAKVCEYCGAVIEGEALEIDGYYYCDDECAFNDNWAICDRCGDWVREDDGSWCDGDFWCDYCLRRYATYCDGCEEYHEDRFTIFYSDHYGNNYCEKYINNSSYLCVCEECGDVFGINDEGGYGNDDCPYCGDCIDEHCGHEYINDYGRTYSSRFYSEDSVTSDEVEGVIYMGVELEIDKGRDADDCACDLRNSDIDISRYDFKEDGSLENGFEIVSQPMTLKYHENGANWDVITETAKKHGFKSHDANTCGLHVHINRGYFTACGIEQVTAEKRLKMIFGNNRDFLVKFSRRDEYNLNRWAAMPTASGENTTSERYNAINNCNKNTIEFRLFRGTLKLETLYATFELVQYIAIYAASHSAVLCAELDLMQADFSSYPYLEKYVNSLF